MTRVWHHHGSDKPTSAGAILLHTDQFSILFCTRLYDIKTCSFLFYLQLGLYVSGLKYLDGSYLVVCSKKQ